MSQDELRKIDEADAWLTYLADTRELKGAKYRDIEPWCWSQLQFRLRSIRRVYRRQKVAA